MGGRSPIGIASLVLGVAYLECRAPDPDAWLDALTPLGFTVMGRRARGFDSPAVLALASGDVRLIISEVAPTLPSPSSSQFQGRSSAAATIVDVAFLVTDVDTAEQIAMAGGALPAPRSRRAGRAVPGPAIGGPGDVVHSLAASGDWLSGVDRLGPVAADRGVVISELGRISLTVASDAVEQWRSYYGVLLGRHAAAGATDQARGAMAGPTFIDVSASPAGPVPAPADGVSALTLGCSDMKAARALLDDASLAYRSVASGDVGDGAVEVPAVSGLLGARVILTGSAAPPA